MIPSALKDAMKAAAPKPAPKVEKPKEQAPKAPAPPAPEAAPPTPPPVKEGDVPEGTQPAPVVGPVKLGPEYVPPAAPPTPPTPEQTFLPNLQNAGPEEVTPLPEIQAPQGFDDVPFILPGELKEIDRRRHPDVTKPDGTVYHYTGTPSSRFAMEIYKAQAEGKQAQNRVQEGGISQLAGDVVDYAAENLSYSPIGVSAKLYRAFVDSDKAKVQKADEAQATINAMGLLDPESQLKPEDAYRLVQLSMQGADAFDNRTTNAAYSKLYFYYMSKYGNAKADLEEQQRVSINAARWATSMLLSTSYFGELPVNTAQLPNVEQHFTAQWRDLVPYPKEGESWAQAAERAKGAADQVVTAVSPKGEQMPTGNIIRGETGFDWLMRGEFALGSLGLAEMGALSQKELTPDLPAVLQGIYHGDMAVGKVLENPGIQQQLRGKNMSDKGHALAMLALALIYDLKAPTASSLAISALAIPREFEAYRAFLADVKNDIEASKNSGKKVGEIVGEVVAKYAPRPVEAPQVLKNADAALAGDAAVMGSAERKTSLVNEAASKLGAPAWATNPIEWEAMGRAREGVAASKTARASEALSEKLHADGGGFFKKGAEASEDAWNDSKVIRRAEMRQEYLNTVSRRMVKKGSPGVKAILLSALDLEGRTGGQAIRENPLKVLEGMGQIEKYKTALKAKETELLAKVSPKSLEQVQKDFRTFQKDLKEQVRAGKLQPEEAVKVLEDEKARLRKLDIVAEQKELGVVQAQLQAIESGAFESAYKEASTHAQSRIAMSISSDNPTRSYFEAPPEDAPVFEEREPFEFGTDGLAQRRTPAMFESAARNGIKGLLENEEVPATMREAIASELLRVSGVDPSIFPSNIKSDISRVRYLIEGTEKRKERLSEATEALVEEYSASPNLAPPEISAAKVTDVDIAAVQAAVKTVSLPEATVEEQAQAAEVLLMLKMTGLEWQNILPEVAEWQREMRYSTPQMWSFALMGEYYAAPGAALKGFKSEFLLPREGSKIFANWQNRVRYAARNYLKGEEGTNHLADWLGFSDDASNDFDTLWIEMEGASHGATETAPSVNAWFRNRLMYYGASESGLTPTHVLQGDTVWVRDPKALKSLLAKTEVKVPGFRTLEEDEQTSSIYVHPRSMARVEQGKGATLLSKSNTSWYDFVPATPKSGVMARVERVNADGSVELQVLEFERQGSPRNVEVKGATITTTGDRLEYMERGRTQRQVENSKGNIVTQSEVLPPEALPKGGVQGVEYVGTQRGRFTLLAPPEQYTIENFRWTPEDLALLSPEEFEKLRERMVAEGVPDMDASGRIPLPRTQFMPKAKTPKVPAAPKAPKTPKAPKVPKKPKVPKTPEEEAQDIITSAFSEAYAKGTGKESMLAAIEALNVPKESKAPLRFVVENMPPAVAERMVLMAVDSETFAGMATKVEVADKAEPLLLACIRTPKTADEATEAVLTLTHEISHHMYNFLPDALRNDLWSAYQASIKKKTPARLTKFLSRYTNEAESFQEWFAWQASEYLTYKRLPEMAEAKNAGLVRYLFDHIIKHVQQFVTDMFALGPWQRAEPSVRQAVDSMWVMPEKAKDVAKMEMVEESVKAPKIKPPTVTPTKVWEEQAVEGRAVNPKVEELKNGYWSAKPKEAEVAGATAPLSSEGKDARTIVQKGEVAKPKEVISSSPLQVEVRTPVEMPKPGPVPTAAQEYAAKRIKLEKEEEAAQNLQSAWNSQGFEKWLMDTAKEKEEYDRGTKERDAAFEAAKKAPALPTFGGPRTPVEVMVDAHIRRELDRVARPEVARPLLSFIERVAEGWAAEGQQNRSGEIATADAALQGLLRVRLDPKTTTSSGLAIAETVGLWLGRLAGTALRDADIGAIIHLIGEVPARHRRDFEALKDIFPLPEDGTHINWQAVQKVLEWIRSGDAPVNAPQGTVRPWLSREGRVPGRMGKVGLEEALRAREDYARSRTEVRSGLQGFLTDLRDTFKTTREIIDNPVRESVQQVLRTLDAKNNDANILLHDWIKQHNYLETEDAELIKFIESARPDALGAWREALDGGTLPQDLMDLAIYAFIDRDRISLSSEQVSSLLQTLKKAIANPEHSTFLEVRNALKAASEAIVPQEAWLDPRFGDVTLSKFFLFGADTHDTLRDLFGLGAVIDAKHQRLVKDWCLGTANSSQALEIVNLAVPRNMSYRRPVGTAIQNAEDIEKARVGVFVQNALTTEERSSRDKALFERVPIVAGKAATPYSARQHLLSLLLESVSVVDPSKMKMAKVGNVWKMSVTSGLGVTLPGFHFGNMVGDSLAIMGHIGIRGGLSVEASMALKPLLAVPIVSNIRALWGAKYGETFFDRLLSLGSWSVDVENLIRGEGRLVCPDGRSFENKGLLSLTKRGNVNDSLMSSNIARDAADHAGARWGWKGTALRAFNNQMDHTSEVAQFISERRRYGLFVELIKAGKEPIEAAEIVNTVLIDYRHNLHPIERNIIFDFLLPFWNFTKGNQKRFTSVMLNPTLWSNTFKANRLYKDFGPLASALLDDRDEWQFDVTAMSESELAQYAKLTEMFKAKGYTPQDVARIILGRLPENPIVGGSGRSGATEMYRIFDEDIRAAFGPEVDAFIIKYFVPDPSRLSLPDSAYTRTVAWSPIRRTESAIAHLNDIKNPRLDAWKFWTLPGAPDQMAISVIANAVNTSYLMTVLAKTVEGALMSKEGREREEALSATAEDTLRFLQGVNGLLQNAAPRSPLTMTLNGALSGNPSLSPSMGSETPDSFAELLPDTLKTRTIEYVTGDDGTLQEKVVYRLNPLFESLFTFMAYTGMSSGLFVAGALPKAVGRTEKLFGEGDDSVVSALLGLTTGMTPKEASAVGMAASMTRAANTRIEKVALQGANPVPLASTDTAVRARTRQAAEVVLSRMPEATRTAYLQRVAERLKSNTYPKDGAAGALTVGMARVMLIESGVLEDTVDSMTDPEVIRALGEKGLP